MGFKGDSALWKEWHSDAKNIPCSICRDEAVILISGIHDLVNIKTDKPVYDEPKLLKFFEIIEERKMLYQRWKRTGKYECAHHICE